MLCENLAQYRKMELESLIRILLKDNNNLKFKAYETSLPKIEIITTFVCNVVC